MSPSTDEPGPSRAEILDRARIEAWEELALGADYQDRDYFLHRGWGEQRIFVGGKSLDMTRLGWCTSLRWLALRDQHIATEGIRALAKLTKLTHLDVSYTHIGDTGARALSKLTKLTHLYLRRNSIGDKGPWPSPT